MDEEAFKEVMKYKQYVNVYPPVFQMTYDDIKYEKICVRTGEYIRFFVNKMFSCRFTISPFIYSDFTI